MNNLATQISSSAAIGSVASLFFSLKAPIIIVSIFIILNQIYNWRLLHKKPKRDRDKKDSTFGTTIMRLMDSVLLISLGKIIDVYIPYLSGNFSLCDFFTWYLCIYHLISIIICQVELNPKGPFKPLQIIVNKKIKKELDIDLEKEMKK